MTHINFPNAIKEFDILLKTVSKTKPLFDSAYSLYRLVMLKMGKLFGLWHSDYSFFHGGLLNVRISDHDEYIAIGELILPVITILTNRMKCPKEIHYKDLVWIRLF
jgi:hypothetical protein